MSNNSFEDVAICPNCGRDMYPYNTDEIEFGIGNEGHYCVDVHCPDCKLGKRLHIHFTYNITDYTMS